MRQQIAQHQGTEAGLATQEPEEEIPDSYFSPAAYAINYQAVPHHDRGQTSGHPAGNKRIVPMMAAAKAGNSHWLFYVGIVFRHGHRLD